MDVAKGEEGCLGTGYKSVGTVKSEFREGNGTVQFEVLPSNATYNTTLNAPNPVEKNGTEGNGEAKRELRKGRKVKRSFKPSFLRD